MGKHLTRREMIKLAGAATAVAGLGTWSSSVGAQTMPAATGRRRVLRLAHLTDVHVQPERGAAEGLVKCLHHMQSLTDVPTFVLTGGDAIMDSFEADDHRTQLQWGLWNKVFKNECSLPVEHCIGNHDIWGWMKSHSKAKGDEPNYGKKRAMENYGLATPYRSFDRAGWHFVVLDSVAADGEGYKAQLDEAQFAWLDEDLRAVGQATPVLVLSHIPIVSITPLIGASAEPRSKWDIGSSLMMLDAVRLKNLFARHPNVKACVSGHIHLVDRVDYNGVTYLCNGAVCGAWWKGKNKECAEGYAVLNLFDDGSIEREYVTYGWTART
jgi:3',5'-cyclic-AMP phosphodiesterase